VARGFFGEVSSFDVILLFSFKGYDLFLDPAISPWFGFFTFWWPSFPMQDFRSLRVITSGVSLFFPLLSAFMCSSFLRRIWV